MDFFQIRQRVKNKGIEICPDFIVGRSKDLMVRGKSFYAIWDSEKGLWSTDEYDVPRLVDKELLEYRTTLPKEDPISVKLMSDFSINSWKDFRNYLSHISDNFQTLDTHITFQNTEVKKKDYVSKRVPYPLDEEGACDAYDEIVGTLYDAENRAKLEWAIGAILAGEAKDIQKFIVIYGEAGAGKSTMLNIIQKLFEGYYTTFEAKALTSTNNAFSTEVFRSNPLVAIQHDGDLSKIEDNTKLNSIISHEEITINEKYKPGYMARINSFLFMATNKPVKITDAKSGIIRRLIDVRTSGKRIPIKRYFELMSRIDFELGAIASKCLKVYREMGKNYYSSYRPLDMIYQTDVFFNFVEANYQIFKDQGGVTLSQAYDMYKVYCDEALVEFKLPRHKFREELKNYFENFSDMMRVDGKQIRSYYSGIIASKFTVNEPVLKEIPSWIVLDNTKSIFDEVCSSCPAQYANGNETPYKKWDSVSTHLSDLDTSRLHYVVLPQNHIVIDFDIKDENGEKSPEKNIEAATLWPPTYAEYSKSQAGIHLHYFYEGDADKLSSIFSEGIEIKVSRVGSIGPSSLRRKLSKCNNIPIATINSGLPLKGEKSVINFEGVKSEKALRNLITRNLNKEIHPGTKPSIDFINKILNDAYNSGLHYDVTDMRQKILVFALNSTHQSDYCVNLVSEMKFKSDEPSSNSERYADESLVFFDVEVFPNLVVVSWKYAGDYPCVTMINPSPQEVEGLMKMKLVGFNCRRYDNHILYAIYVGYTNTQVFNMSQKIIGESRNALFGEAYNISYADVYDFSSKKQSLKKFQIELGLHHRELGFPWDEPVPQEAWNDVIEYCNNDVITTEAVFNDRHEDFVARQILADLSGLTVNDTTQQHAAKIIFGNDPRPQEKFVYTDLSTIFPGYKFENGKSSYRGEDPGEGGEVYAEPGFYQKVRCWDVISMHGTSIERLNSFGEYTKRYSELKAARVAIKHKDYETAKSMLNGVLAKYLTTPEQSAKLSYALKIIINIVYGLTSASFPNKFRDPRNIDNIVAKRGALFMIDLKHAVQEQGWQVVHIKTDSIKIPNYNDKMMDFITEFGKKYGYEFEVEATYDKFCLVNDAVYIARYGEGDCKGQWTAVGAQFAHPYVFKTLFSKEKIDFADKCEAKSVTTALYLDMNENDETNHHYVFVGKTSLFCPMKPGCGGGILLSKREEKYNAVTGTKGWRWLEADVVRELRKEDDIELGYFRKLVDDAKKSIEKFVDFEQFVN